MEKINEVSVYIQGAIFVGVTFRVIYCAIRLQGADEEAAQYKRRIKHSIIFLVISQLAFVIKDLITKYYN